MFLFQVEYTNRLDFVWREQCTNEKKELQDTSALNEKLLQNILPKHVAEYFLKAPKSHDVRIVINLGVCSPVFDVVNIVIIVYMA